MSSFFGSFLSRLRTSLGSPPDGDDDVDEEISGHLLLLQQRFEAQGMTPGEARRCARAAFGGVGQLKEDLREQQSIVWLDQVRQDVRYACRTIRSAPMASLAVVVTLALGIGANAAIFSLVNNVLLTPLPYSDPERIVAVEPFWKNTGGTNPTSSAPDFHDWRQQNHVLDFLAYHAGRQIRAIVNGAPMFASIQFVTPDFFGVFGMSPAAGRVWTQLDGDAPVAVVGHEWALAQFGDVRAAVGRTLTVFDRNVEILGVAAREFRYPGSTDIWVPNSLVRENSNRSGHNYLVVGKLKAGVTLEEARGEMRSIADRLEREYPENRFKSVALTPLRDKLTSGARTTLWLLFGTVIGVMLIACVNVANLQLVRAASRGREMAVRCAIGAGPGRIVRQVLTENVLLGLAGCLVGLLVGWLVLRAFLALAPADIPRVDEVRIDGRVFLFTLAITTLCSLLFGMGPARRASRADVSAGLRHHAGRGVLGGVAPRVRSALVIGEVALSVILLVAAGLLLRSFAQLTRVDLGFSTDRVLVTTTAVPVPGPDGPRRATAFYRDLIENVRALPGVRRTAGVMTMPFVQQRSNSSYSIDGGPTYAQGERPDAQIQVVTPGYFDTMNTSIRQGRDFNDGDRFGQPQVAIVNERLVREAFGRENPIGRIIRTGMTRESANGMQIVGVVADARQMSPEALPRPEIFLPYLQHPGPGSRLALVTQTAIEPDALAASIREAARALNPEVPVRFSTMDEVFSRALAYPRFRTVLVAAFALLAVMLALVGIYGVVSYLVAERTSEIGVRLALGARRRDIFGRVIGGSMRLVWWGLLVGAIGAVAAVRALQTVLFGVSPRDPLTLVTVMALLALTALAASSIPALRATRVDPLVALRQD
jgi:predicted permease